MVKFVAIVSALVFALMLAPASAGGGGNNEKVTLCHATGSATNPYDPITIPVNAIFGAHMDHQNNEDIIPPFFYGGEWHSMNWPAGEATFNNGCAVPTPVTPVPTQTPVTPEPTVTTPEPTPTDVATPSPTESVTPTQPATPEPTDEATPETTPTATDESTPEPPSTPAVTPTTPPTSEATAVPTVEATPTTPVIELPSTGTGSKNGTHTKAAALLMGVGVGFLISVVTIRVARNNRRDH